MQFEIMEVPAWQPPPLPLPDEEEPLPDIIPEWLPGWLEDQGIYCMPNAKITFNVPIYPDRE